MDKGENPVRDNGGKDIAAKSEWPSVLDRLKQPAVSHSGQDKKKISLEQNSASGIIKPNKKQ